MGSLVIAAVCMTSCATIFTGTKDRIYFKSNVPGATVSLNDNELCKTPCDTKIKRRLGTTMVEVKADGYEPKLIELDKQFNIVSVINLTNLIGWGIDLATGSVMSYDQKVYKVELTKTK